ncbi:hypothetical protein EDB87DRAFT_1646935 [Lactarius vividus]|nr:hypothetical protein EDB87DRAFT_1646935 [Lactarius vividus]
MSGVPTWKNFQHRPFPHTPDFMGSHPGDTRGFSQPYRRQIRSGFSVLPRRVDIQPHPLSVSVIGPGGHVQSPRTAPKRRRNKTSTAPANAHPRPSKPKPLVQWLCPVSGCGVPSRRPQERDRHLLSHLPCSIACSIGPCLWRGERVDTFKKHLCKKHRINEPDGHGYLAILTHGFISVKEMSSRIGKLEFSEDPSGPKRKKGSHL